MRLNFTFFERSVGAIIKHTSILRFYFCTWETCCAASLNAIHHTLICSLHRRQHLLRFVSPQHKNTIATCQHICFSPSCQTCASIFNPSCVYLENAPRECGSQLEFRKRLVLLILVPSGHQGERGVWKCRSSGAVVPPNASPFSPQAKMVD